MHAIITISTTLALLVIGYDSTKRKMDYHYVCIQRSVSPFPSPHKKRKEKNKTKLHVVERWSYVLEIKLHQNNKVVFSLSTKFHIKNLTKRFENIGNMVW